MTYKGWKQNTGENSWNSPVPSDHYTDVNGERFIWDGRPTMEYPWF